eukprot:scaffold1697_cov180-Amphora_coffeaeformis.AAC.10
MKNSSLHESRSDETLLLLAAMVDYSVGPTSHKLTTSALLPDETPNADCEKIPFSIDLPWYVSRCVNARVDHLIIIQAFGLYPG